MPRFYLIGVPKCGTTTLYYSLVRHPLVAQPFGKESHFWSRSLNMGADYFAKNFTIRAGEKFLECVPPSFSFRRSLTAPRYFCNFCTIKASDGLTAACGHDSLDSSSCALPIEPRRGAGKTGPASSMGTFLRRISPGGAGRFYQRVRLDTLVKRPPNSKCARVVGAGPDHVPAVAHPSPRRPPISRPCCADVVQKATLRLSERTAGDSQPAAGALAALDRPVSDMRDGGKAWDTLMKRLSSEAPADDSGGDGAGDGAAASRPGVRNASAWENEMLRHVPLPEALRYRQPGAKIVVRASATMKLKTTHPAPPLRLHFLSHLLALATGTEPLLTRARRSLLRVCAAAAAAALAAPADGLPLPPPVQRGVQEQSQGCGRRCAQARTSCVNVALLNRSSTASSAPSAQKLTPSPLARRRLRRKTEGDACLCPINAENFGRLMRDALGFMQARALNPALPPLGMRWFRSGGSAACCAWRKLSARDAPPPLLWDAPLRRDRLASTSWESRPASS